MNINEIANNILINEFIIPKTDITENRIDTVSQEIFSSPETRRDRTEEQVRTSCEALILEDWVSENTDFNINPLEFDHTNKHSYAYDLVSNDNKTMEIKTCINFNTQYWNIYSWAYIKTMMNNLDIIDYIYVAEFTRNEKEYIVKPKLLLTSDQVKGRINKSKFNSGYYYMHKPIKNEILYKGNLA